MSYNPIYLFLSTILLGTAVTARAQVMPSNVTLGPSQQQQFTLVQEQLRQSQQTPAQSTSWTVVPSQDGKITATGLFTAASAIPVATSALVYAQSGSILYEAKVQLNPETVGSTGPVNPTSVPVSISVSPTFAYMYAGQTRQFMASITGSANQQALWSITQGPGTILDGLYSAPLSVAVDQLVTISATSVADPTKSVSVTVLVGPVVTPSSPTGGSSPPVNPTTTSVTPAKASV